MYGVARVAAVATLTATAFTLLFVPRAAHRAIDADEPIAANGSMIAGGSRTIFDTNPLLGALGQPPRPNLDDPKVFEERMGWEKTWSDQARVPISKLIGPLDAERCQDIPREKLIGAVRIYYGARGRQIYSFSLGGPHAKAAIEQAWSTPLDRQIDEFVRRALQSGFLHKNEVPPNVYPEFAKTFADTQEIGTACPPLKIENGDVKL
jgi:hypothetical protein